MGHTGRVPAAENEIFPNSLLIVEASDKAQNPINMPIWPTVKFWFFEGSLHRRRRLGFNAIRVRFHQCGWAGYEQSGTGTGESNSRHRKKYQSILNPGAGTQYWAGTRLRLRDASDTYSLKYGQDNGILPETFMGIFVLGCFCGTINNRWE